MRIDRKKSGTAVQYFQLMRYSLVPLFRSNFDGKNRTSVIIQEESLGFGEVCTQS